MKDDILFANKQVLLFCWIHQNLCIEIYANFWASVWLMILHNFLIFFSLLLLSLSSMLKLTGQFILKNFNLQRPQKQ